MAHDNVVVCGIDGSEQALNALRWAAHQAMARQARLHVVCSYEVPTYAAHAIAYGHDDTSYLYDAAQKMVDDAVASIAADGLEVTSALEAGDPTTVLVELSKTAALLVVGGRGGQSLADRILRTVSSALPAYAKCPTVVVPSTPVEDLLPVKHIVVGFDGSDTSLIALQRGVWEAERWGARLTVVSAVNFGSVSWVPEGGYHDEVIADVRKSLKEALDKVERTRDIRIDTHALEGNPAQLMAEFSTAVDLLVMGSRGRGGFAGVLLGSTSQTVLQQAHCPVMIVPRAVREDDDVAPAVWRRPI